MPADSDHVVLKCEIKTVSQKILTVLSEKYIKRSVEFFNLFLKILFQN